MKYLERWYEDLVSKPSMPIEHAIQLQGVHDEHLGPRDAFAMVEFLIEPAPEFDVAVKLPDGELTSEQRMFLDHAVFGFLDVVLTTETYPIRAIRLTIVNASFHAISSSAMAFRQAGRDAARQFLDRARSQ